MKRDGNSSPLSRPVKTSDNKCKKNAATVERCEDAISGQQETTMTAAVAAEYVTLVDTA